jgi:hypothetical protein
MVTATLTAGGVEARGVLAGREVATVVEGAGGDVGFDAVEDLLDFLPVGGRVGKRGLFPAADIPVAEVQKERLLSVRRRILPMAHTSVCHRDREAGIG